MKNLLHSLELGLTCPVYLFYGDEEYLMEEALARLAALVAPGDEAWNRESLDAEEHEIAEVLLTANSGGFFGGKKLVVVRNIPWFRPKRKKGTNEEAGEEAEAAEPTRLDELLAYLDDPNPDTVLVLMVKGKLNKNSRVIKAARKSGNVTEFASLRPEERELWLRNYFRAAGCRVAADACAFLSLVGGESLLALSQEADKLLLYAGGQGEITLAEAEAIVSRNSLAGIFDLTDQVATCDGSRCVNSLRRLLRQGEAPEALLGMLASQYRSMLAVKDLSERGFSSAQAASAMAMSPYYAQKCARQSRNYSFRQLVRILDILLAADIESKRSSRERAGDLLELAVLRICALTD